MSNITDHTNLTKEQKEALGSVHAMNKSIETIIFEFEHSRYKDYEKLAQDIMHKVNRRKHYGSIANSLDIPQENINLFNKGIVTGLINPNKITYTAYYE